MGLFNFLLGAILFDALRGRNDHSNTGYNPGAWSSGNDYGYDNYCDCSDDCCDDFCDCDF